MLSDPTVQFRSEFRGEREGAFGYWCSLYAIPERHRQFETLVGR